MIVNAILLAVFVVVVAALWREGLWGSLVVLVNVLFAATAATILLPEVVAVVRPRFESYRYVVDAVVLWGLFALILTVAREVTDRLSRTHVRFRKPVEMFGTPLVAALAAWVTMAFTATAIHTAPVPKGIVPQSGMFFGIAPDRGWLRWIAGTVGKPPFGSWGRSFDPPGAPAAPVADGAEPPSASEQADRFIEHYARRRLELETLESLRIPTG
jgi:hypothetical protein